MKRESIGISEAFQGKTVCLINQVADPFSERVREQIANIIRRFGMDAEYGNEVLENGWHLVIVSEKSPAVISSSESIFTRLVLEEYREESRDTFSIRTAAVKNALYELLIQEEMQKGILSHVPGSLSRLIRGWSFAAFCEDWNEWAVMKIHEEGFFERKEQKDEKMFSHWEDRERILCLIKDDEGNEAAVLDYGENAKAKKTSDGKAEGPECRAAKLCTIEKLSVSQKDGLLLCVPEAAEGELAEGYETRILEIRTKEKSAFALSSLFSLFQTGEERNGTVLALPFPARYLRESIRRNRADSL